MKGRLLNIMSNKTIFTNIGKLYTLQGGIRVKEQLADNHIIEHAYLYVEDGIIQEVGEMKNVTCPWKDVTVVDLKNALVTPGFIDSHTHLIFAGNRNHEYIEKIKGKSYLDILQSGGGIHATVAATQDATIPDLFKDAFNTSQFMLSRGVTTMEVKSGYGLDFLTEVKMLHTIALLNEKHSTDFIPTYLGAHAVPSKYQNHVEDYITFMKETVMPYIKKENLATFIDVFCEKGVFSYEQSEELLKQAQALGFKLKLHADELTSTHGAALASKYHCISADHLIHATKEDLLLMKDAGVVATLLPMTSFNLRESYADVTYMKEQGLILALASDYNPGSSPCSDFIMMMRVASRVYRLLPSEVLSMITINAAKALDLDYHIGSIEKGKQADFLVFDNENFDHIIINMGPTTLSKVYKKGNIQEVHLHVT